MAARHGSLRIIFQSSLNDGPEPGAMGSWQIVVRSDSLKNPTNVSRVVISWEVAPVGLIRPNPDVRVWPRVDKRDYHPEICPK